MVTVLHAVVPGIGLKALGLLVVVRNEDPNLALPLSKVLN
jgi:hypothetical protein